MRKTALIQVNRHRTSKGKDDRRALVYFKRR
jgi:hypothetical protein